LSRTSVEFSGDVVELGLGSVAEASAGGKVLARSICVHAEDLSTGADAPVAAAVGARAQVVRAAFCAFVAGGGTQIAESAARPAAHQSRSELVFSLFDRGRELSKLVGAGLASRGG
jgi:hypothetical protein